MFTPGILLDIAVRAFEAYNGANNSSDRCALHREYENAFKCAEWMEDEGIAAMPMVGPFGNPSIKRDQKVRIKKGARITSMHPQRKAPYEAKVSYVVKVWNAFEGWVGDCRHIRGAIDVRQPQVHWAGAGGYWCWTEASNVELVESDA